jgi:hypothetical protein
MLVGRLSVDMAALKNERSRGAACLEFWAGRERIEDNRRLNTADETESVKRDLGG